MLRVLVMVAVAATLCACSSVTSDHVLSNLQGCERHYDGAVSAGMTGGQFSGTVKVDCPSTAPTAPPH